MAKKEMQEAIKLILDTNDELNRLSDILSDDIRNEDFEKVNLIYFLAAQLNVAASQLTGEAKTYEGACIVNNGRAEVIIDGFAVRGNVQFEVMVDGNWIKGHRENSQYGQIFRGKETTFILTNEYTGRVSLPLVMDN